MESAGIKEHYGIGNVSPIEEEMPIAMQEVKTSNPCGIVLLGGSFGYTNENYHNFGIPCVLVTIRASGSVAPELYSSVMVDDVLEMKRATEYLRMREGIIAHMEISEIFS